MTSTLKPTFFHKLKTRLFGNCSSSGPKSWGLTGDVKSAWLRFVFTSTVAICCSRASYIFFTIHALPNVFVSNIHMVMTIPISCVTVKLLLWNFPLHIFSTMLYLHYVSANSILHTNVLMNTDPPCVSYWLRWFVWTWWRWNVQISSWRWTSMC